MKLAALLAERVTQPDCYMVTLDILRIIICYFKFRVNSRYKSKNERMLEVPMKLACLMAERCHATFLSQEECTFY